MSKGHTHTVEGGIIRGLITPESSVNDRVHYLEERNEQLERYFLGIRNGALPFGHSLAVLLGYEAGLKEQAERPQLGVQE